jgi:hypothetical protein
LPTPGKNASIRTTLLTSAGYCAAYAYATIRPNVVPNQLYLFLAEQTHETSNVLRKRLLVVPIPRALRATSAAQVRRDHGVGRREQGISGIHIWLVWAKPCSKTTTGPRPPIL